MTMNNTIKDVYKKIQNGDEGPGIAQKFMKNISNRIRVVFWETTAGCNLQCIHCRRLETAQEMMKEDLSTDESFHLLDQIAQTGTCIVILSGGEPLFRPDIFDIAQYGAGLGLTMALGSNGTLIDGSVARKIKNAGIQRVSISLDGIDAQTHDSFRQTDGAFNAAIRGIRHLQQQGVETQINSSIARHNVHQVEGLYRLALDLGVVAFHIFMLVPVGCGLNITQEQMLDPGTYENVLNRFYDFSKENRIQTKATCAPHYFRIMRQRAKKEGIEITPRTHGMAAMTKGCLAGTSVCFVSHKGSVFPCGYFPVEAGNIRKQHFKTIWETSPLFADLRDPDRLKGKCGICEYKRVCGGCRARAYARNKDYLDEEPYCTYEPETVQR